MSHRLLCALATLGGCLTPVDTAPPSSPPELPVEVLDFHGNDWPELATPRRPRLLVTPPAVAHPTGAELMVVSWQPGDDAARPKSQISERALKSMRRHLPDGRWELVPAAPLPACAGYAVVWMDDTKALPLVRRLQASCEPSAGAALVATWPAEGTAGVPTRLPWLALRFDGPVSVAGRAVVRSDNGSVVAAAVEPVPCGTAGWTGATCLGISPAGDLARLSEHTVAVPVLDATGAPLGEPAISFRTGARPSEPVRLTTPACAVDELELDIGCLLASEDSVVLRVRASGPLRLFLAVGEAEVGAVAARGIATLRVGGLPSQHDFESLLRGINLGGHELSRTFRASTLPPLPRLYITEVRSDPLGPEPAQEYVEVLNAGDHALDLAGYQLADAPDRVGDVIAAPAQVPARGRALLVPEGFDPSAGHGDAAIEPGLVLIRLDRSLANAGLSNAGEPVFLRDTEGRRLSAAPAVPRPGPGRCIERITADGRRGDPGTFAYLESGGCSPGH